MSLPLAKHKATAAPSACATKAAKVYKSTVKLIKCTAASTAGGNADESSSDVEVEIVGEHPTEKKVIHGSSIIPPHSIKSLPVHVAPMPLSKGKGKALELTTTMEQVLILKTSENSFLGRRTPSSERKMSQEMVSISNKTYAMVQNWVQVENELGNILE
ncbi:hypothetical protein BDR05DRAFT_1001617 [Suillus weaverae]|nr:hypothetical protein BDR05DRAFT_1001617 [Suillus weaverae]